MPTDYLEAAKSPSWLKSGRVPCLDGFRGLSILVVILSHAAVSSGFPINQAAGQTLYYTGTSGVRVFFVISGFLITLLLLREQDRTGTISLQAFYRRRALRILPLYVAYLAAVFLISTVGFLEVTSRDWLLAATYTSSLWETVTWEVGHTWSLSVEEQFYLLWPLAILVIGRKRAGYLAVGTILASLVLRPALAQFTDLNPSRHTLARMDDIAIGCLLALAASDPRFLAVTARFKSHLPKVGLAALAACAGSIIVVAAASASDQFSSGSALAAIVSATRYRLLNGPVEALLIAVAIWSLACSGPNLVRRFLETRTMVWLGTLSYSLYLWQQLFLSRGSDVWARTFPWNLILAGATAYAAHRFVEVPFLKLKDRIAHGEAAENRVLIAGAASEPARS